MKCEDCGKEIVDGGTILQMDVSLEHWDSKRHKDDDCANGSLHLCDTCEPAVCLEDILAALPIFVVSELRKARLPCASTREVMGEEAGDGK